MFDSSGSSGDSMLPALFPSGAPVSFMSDSTQDRLNVSHSERDFSVAINLKLDLRSAPDAGISLSLALVSPVLRVLFFNSDVP